jgi:hypothetical protein
MQHRGPTHNIILILLFVVPICCGLVALGGAIAYATRPHMASQPPPASPLPILTRPIIVPTPSPNALTLYKLGEQGLNDFLLADPALIENPPDLEKQLKEYCDRYRRDFCYLFVWRSKTDAALVLPMTDVQLNTQAAQYKRNKTTGYDCFAMLKNGEMIKETVSAGCTPPTTQPTSSPVIPTQMPTIAPASMLPTARPTSSLVIPTRTPTIAPVPIVTTVRPLPTATIILTLPTAPPASSGCCKHCGPNSQPCGDSCISRSYTCHKGAGCACP